MKIFRAIGCVLALLVGETDGTLYAVGPDKDTSRAVLYKVDDVTGASTIVNAIHNTTDDGTIYFTGNRYFHSLVYDNFRGHLVGLVKYNPNTSEMLFIDERNGRVLKTYPARSEFHGTLAIDGFGRIYVGVIDQGGIWYLLSINTTTGVGRRVGDRHFPGIYGHLSVAFDDNDVLHVYGRTSLSAIAEDWHWIVDHFTGDISRQHPSVGGTHFATQNGDVRPRSQLLYAPGSSYNPGTYGSYVANKIQIVNLENKVALPWIVSTNIPRIDAVAFDQHSGAQLDNDCVFGQNIPLNITVPVPYYGNIPRLAENGLISEAAVLHIAAYDIDYHPTRPTPSNGTRYHVYFNNEKVGVLTGSPGKWKMNMFSIPLETIVFPDDARKGGTLDPGRNEVGIEVTGTGPVECIKVDKIALTIDKVPRPVLLVHGFQSGEEMWVEGPRRWANHLTALGIPFDGEISLGGFDSIEGNSRDLGIAIADARRRWGVDKLNIVSHSKGGLDSRHYIENHDEIAQLIQIATPNGGTPVVEMGEDFLLEVAVAVFGNFISPASAFINAILANIGSIALLDFAVPQLSMTHMWYYNLVHGYNQNVRYTVLAGDFRPDGFQFPTYYIMNVLVGAGDGVVPVTSAFALDYTSDEFLYSSTTLDASHGGGSGGLPQSEYVLNKLIGNIEDPFRYELQPRRLVSRANLPNRHLPSSNVQSFTVAGAVASGEVLEFPLEVDLSLEAYVLFAYTSGNLVFNLTQSQVPSSASEVNKDEGNKTVIYSLLDIEEGSWVASVTGDVVEQASAEFVIFVLLRGSPITLEASLKEDSVAVGSPLTYFGTLTHEDEAPVPGATVSAVVLTPTEDVDVIFLLDDGIGPDEVADDGIYTGQFFDTSVPGNYRASIRADGDVPVSFSRDKYVLGVVTVGSLTLDDNFSDEGTDDNLDGYFDGLVVLVSVDASARSVYRIFGELTDSAGNSQTTSFDTELESGINSVEVVFDGREIFQNRVDGPYFFTALRCAEERELSIALLAEMNEIYETAAYSFRDFQHDPIHLWKSTVETRGTDTDGDDFYDVLRVTVSVDIHEEGEYLWSASLRDTNGTEIGDYLSESTNLASGTNAITFEFNGTLIAENGVDGPFSVAELIIDGFYSVVVIGNAFDTGPINADEFDRCPNDSINACIGGTAVPSSVPPTGSPSATPSSVPSATPSASPSASPSSAPSGSPSSAPSLAPSAGPSSAPSASPSGKPSSEPSGSPSASSAVPSSVPSLQPSIGRTGSPSSVPSSSPSSDPSSHSSAGPTSGPTPVLTVAPDDEKDCFKCNDGLVGIVTCLITVVICAIQAIIGAIF